MAGKVSGFAVAYTAFGGLLIYSGVKGTSLTATFTDLAKGKLDTTETSPVVSAGTVSAAGVVSGNASQNYLTIANYLVENGYSKAAAAGICGCIAGESGGNPEAEATPGSPPGGAGLIQWTGSSYSQYQPAITGNASADLDQQLPLIVAYNNAQGASLVAMLNQITDPVQAADFYSQYFERPAVANSDVVPSVAQSVYAQITAGSVTGTTSTVNGVTQYMSANGYSY